MCYIEIESHGHHTHVACPSSPLGMRGHKCYHWGPLKGFLSASLAGLSPAAALMCKRGGSSPPCWWTVMACMLLLFSTSSLSHPSYSSCPPSCSTCLRVLPSCDIRPSWCAVVLHLTCPSSWSPCPGHSSFLLKVLVHLAMALSIAYRSGPLCVVGFRPSVVIQSRWVQKPLEYPTWAVDWCEHVCWRSPSTGHPSTTAGERITEAIIEYNLRTSPV